MLGGSLWRPSVPAEECDSLWSAFRASTREWSIGPQSYRVLSDPAERRNFALWARVARAESVTAVIGDWLADDGGRAPSMRH